MSSLFPAFKKTPLPQKEKEIPVVAPPVKQEASDCSNIIKGIKKYNSNMPQKLKEV